MKILEYTFAPEINPEIQRDLLHGIESAASLEELFDGLFLKKGYRMGMGVAINDDGSLNSEAIALYFNTSDGKDVCTTFLSRSEVASQYPEIVRFDSFIKGWSRHAIDFDMREDSYKAWMQGMGFKETWVLMGIIGPRRAAIPLMVSVALSKGGGIEAHHIDVENYDVEDYQADLDEEGIVLEECFTLHASFCKHPESATSPRSIFHPFYCHKLE